MPRQRAVFPITMPAPGSMESSTLQTTRLENTTVCLPLVHGSVAWYLGKKADEFQTHQWTLYLRGANNEDLSVCIQKVVFQLHTSFQQPLREYTSAPFEVTEKGWGEFDAQIRVYWKDPNEKPIVLNHGIKLYPPGTPANTLPTNTEKPVVAESYDEVVFTNPNESFFRALQTVREAPLIGSQYSQHEHFGTFTDTDNMHALLEAQKFLQTQLRTIRERLKLVQQDSVRMEEQIVQHIEKQKQEKQKQQQQQRRTNSTSRLATATTTTTTDKKKSNATSGISKGRPMSSTSTGGEKHKTTSNKKLKQTIQK